MKKIFTFLCMGLYAVCSYAALGLRVNGSPVSSDTTITITDVEDDFGESMMGWIGSLSYNKGNLTVYIERSSEGLVDQLCAGTCINGNGALRDTMDFDLIFYDRLPIQVYAHYYPASLDRSETIRYRFVGADEDFTLTVVYAPSLTALPQTEAPLPAVKILRRGQVVVRRAGVEYNLLGDRQ